MRWSFGRPSPRPGKPIRFGAEFAPAFASAAQALRVKNPERNTSIVGRVVALCDDDQGGGSIVVEAEVTEDSATRVRPVRIGLTSEQYQLAIGAKAAHRRIAAEGDLQRTRLLELRPLRTLRIAEEHEDERL